jgi:hypothetical protein
MGGFGMNNGKSPKEILLLVAEQCGFCPKNKNSTIATIVAKGVNLFLGILFLVLRNKAKADGKVCKANIYLSLSVLFFVGILTSRADIEDDEEAITEAFDADFEDEFE